MSISRDQSIRTDLEKLYRQISTRFSLLNFFFDDPLSSTDMENPKWKDEGEECKRLSDRFEMWARTYRLGAAGQLGTEHPNWSTKTPFAVPDLTSLSWKDDPDRPSENCSDSSSDDGKQRRPSRVIPDEKRTEDDIKEQYERLLLKIAHQLYEVERFNFGRGDDVQALYTAHLDAEGQIDQEEKDPNREVYKPLYKGENDMTIVNKLFNSIRETPVVAPPRPDWESHLKELVPDTASTVTDGPR
ncbi:hypothetical protein NEUTE1DRAFT_113575 [Neurospora tetrasperma FGSC 2508]|uniref:Uncharacterized protein n=1 Tax=Neurospora tetrasperma (strain FGSC 2508 / ATCC MYA-4615 / P0657) TaxID=510951 RepID=F8MY22_NEUT8|nr:uncharacterized protein NEUTE1DRAFT_113575 [Neurospora tetrasperma FGSC 2508]EGO51504.1 hypothetical protein NEUTE1DRAFT_113575 [Neurospora tetrasperma FGSC 2508]EGZ78510.1 hypothetical protein NEUTE2DRAFT_125026 [Neurospora tetrasperma FGSC 2509]